MIKMIGIDLDDTLLRDDCSISLYTQEILRAAMNKGVRIVVATGRMFQAARPLGKVLGLGDVPMVCYTGSVTGLCESGNIVRSVSISKEKAKEILEVVKENGWEAQVYVDDELYVEKYTDNVEDYEVHCKVKAHVIGEELYNPQKDPTKILICEHDEEKMAKVEEIMREKFSHDVNQVKSKPYFFEMNHKDCSKANALLALCKEYGFETEELMTFGNGDNDVSMLSMTPWSFAVENATENAKKAASHLTASNNDDGVAKAIKRYVLEA